MWITCLSARAANDAALVEVQGSVSVDSRQRSFLARSASRVSAKARASSLEQAIDLLLEHEAARLARGEITQQSFQITCQRARGEISAFFKHTTVERIDRGQVERFVTDLSSKQIRASTIKAYLVVLRKLLTRCLQEQWIERLPAFPTVKAPTAPRGHFTVSEYVGCFGPPST